MPPRRQPGRRRCDRADSAAPGGNTRANMLHMSDLWPFPVDAVNEALKRAHRVVAVEVNATAQLATLIRAQSGRAVDDTLLRYDGRSFTPEYILDRLEG